MSSCEQDCEGKMTNNHVLCGCLGVMGEIIIILDSLLLLLFFVYFKRKNIKIPQSSIILIYLELCLTSKYHDQH